jgi:acetolactate synthase-1/2/3 large subunit
MKFLMATRWRLSCGETLRRAGRTLGCDGSCPPSRELRPALERAFESGRPTLVNVLTDPEVVYPRKSNLA